MPKVKTKPKCALLSFTDKMHAVRIKRADGTTFLASGVHGHPRLEADKEYAKRFRDDLASHGCEGRVITVRVSITEVSR